MSKQERLKTAFQYLKSIGAVHTQKDVAEAMGASEPNFSLYAGFSSDNSAPADVQPLGYHSRIIAAPPERHHEQVPRVHDLLTLGLRHYVALRNPRDLAHVTQDAGEYL